MGDEWKGSERKEETEKVRTIWDLIDQVWGKIDAPVRKANLSINLVLCRNKHIVTAADNIINNRTATSF